MKTVSKDAAAKEKRGGKLKEIVKSREFFTFCLLVVVFLFAFMLSDSFRDLTYILKCATRYVELGMVAYTLTFIIIAGMIDLSAPGVMCCSATIAATVFHMGAGMGLALAAGLLTGLILGAINGLLISYAKLPAMIVTIGTMNAFRGIAQILIGDKSLGKFPEWFNSWEKIPVFKIGTANFSVTLLLFVLLGVVAWIVLHKTRFGRTVFAIGANEHAAVCAGVNTQRVKFALFCAEGVMCAVAGILTMSRLQLVRFDMALNQEVDIITMVLLGGTDINGGRGGILGTFLAVLLVIILKTGLIVANITSDQQTFVMGLILLLSIIVPNIMDVAKKRKDK